MARFARLKVLNTIVETGMVPVFYHPEIEVARQVAAAVAAGGCPLLEFTNRGDHAWEVFTELERYCAREVPSLVLGVGSVVDPGTASLYINCGANFVVGPVLNPDVARACNRRKDPLLAGLRERFGDLASRGTGLRDRQDLPGRGGGWPGVREGREGSLPMGFHHAHRRGG